MFKRLFVLQLKILPNVITLKEILKYKVFLKSDKTSRFIVLSKGQYFESNWL